MPSTEKLCNPHILQIHPGCFLTCRKETPKKAGNANKSMVIESDIESGVESVMSDR